MVKFSTDDPEFSALIKNDPTLFKVYKAGIVDGINIANIALHKMMDESDPRTPQQKKIDALYGK